jgi:hypothetical protein
VQHEGPYAYVVLTIDPKEYAWNSEKAWVELERNWNRLIKRMRREWGKFEYVAVVEQHQNEWPHINLIVAGGDFAAAVAGYGWKDVRREGSPFQLMTRECGFGIRLWVEPVRSVVRIGPYASKLSGEVSKKSQVPTAAPRGFRRLRSSKGFLPAARIKNPDITGRLVFTPLDNALGVGYDTVHEGIPKAPVPVVWHDCATPRGSSRGGDLVKHGVVGGAREDPERPPGIGRLVEGNDLVGESCGRCGKTISHVWDSEPRTSSLSNNYIVVTWKGG